MADLAYREPEDDAIDALISALNAATGGSLTFERDVLDTDRPEDWGAVEMTGTENEWADGRIIDQALLVDIWAAVSDRGSDWLRVIEGVLKSSCLHYRLNDRAYLHDVHKVLWRWKASIGLPASDPETREEPAWQE